MSSTMSNLPSKTKLQLEVSSPFSQGFFAWRMSHGFCVFVFEAQCYCVTQARLEFMILLPQPSYCWDYRPVPRFKALLYGILRGLLQFRYFFWRMLYSLWLLLIGTEPQIMTFFVGSTSWIWYLFIYFETRPPYVAWLDGHLPRRPGWP